MFEQTVRRAVQVNDPPPASTAVTATTLGALAALGTQNYFSPSARERLAIVLTDGESRPFDVQATARALARRPGVNLILVHVSSPGEAVYDEGGRPEQGYHGDPASGEIVAGLARATGGSSFGEGRIGAVAAAARAALGTGPTPAGRTDDEHDVAGAVRRARRAPAAAARGRGRPVAAAPADAARGGSAPRRRSPPGRAKPAPDGSGGKSGVRRRRGPARHLADADRHLHDEDAGVVGDLGHGGYTACASAGRRRA